MNTYEKLMKIKQCKEDIKQALLAKGATLGAFDTYASAIANLPSGGTTDIEAETEKSELATVITTYGGTVPTEFTKYDDTIADMIKERNTVINSANTAVDSLLS